MANDLVPPAFVPEWPSFLPAAARAKAAATLAGFCVSVDIRLPATATPGEQHPLVAASPHHRRHRRLTHAERRALMAAPTGTDATLTFVRRPRGPSIRPLP